MTNQKNASGKSGRAFAMTAKEADISIASLFYFQSKMTDPVMKGAFEKTLLKHMTEHAATGIRRPHEASGNQKKMPRERISTWTVSDNYLDKPLTTRKSALLTYATKMICEEKANGEANPYKQFFAQYADYMFADKQTSVVFTMQRPKIVTVAPEEGFKWKNLFKRKSAHEKLLQELSENVNDFMNEPFATGIHDYHEKECLKKLQQNIDSFVDKVAPVLESSWKKEGLEMPLILVPQAVNPDVLKVA